MFNKIGITEKHEQIYQLTTLVAGEFSQQEVLEKLAEAAVKVVGVKACSIRLLDEEAGELKMRSTYGLSEKYRDKGPVTKDDPVIKAAFAGEAVIVEDMRADDRVIYKKATIDEGLVSQLTVAMVFRNKPIGVLRLYSPTPKHFNEDDIAVARSVASQSAVAITNARLYARAIEGVKLSDQMKLGGLIQRRMIPQSAPEIASLDIGATYIPCFEVGGDFYDFLPIGNNHLAIGIADVIGKGIPAAIMMSSFRGALRAYVQQTTNPEPMAIIEKLNKMTCLECKDGEFISLFFAVIDYKNKTLTYCNCGHEPTIMIRKGKVKDLEKGGLVLGVEPNADYEFETMDLQEGDSFVFYTDGLIDAVNFDGDRWGRERMVETVRLYSSVGAKQLVNEVLRFRRRFVGLANQVDDTSIIAIKVCK